MGQDACMASPTVALRYVSGGPRFLDVSLPHAVYCEGGGRCRCARGTAHVPERKKDRSVRMTVVRQDRCHTVMIEKGCEVGGFHRAVLRVPMVASAIRAGLLAARDEPELPAAVKPPVAAAPPAPPAPAEAPVAPAAELEVEQPSSASPSHRRSRRGGDAS